jgi:hypothetical protein
VEKRALVVAQDDIGNISARAEQPAIPFDSCLTIRADYRYDVRPAADFEFAT